MPSTAGEDARPRVSPSGRAPTSTLEGAARSSRPWVSCRPGQGRHRNGFGRPDERAWPSVVTAGDRYDNGLAEIIHRRGPRKTREAVELDTWAWAARYEHHCLPELIGCTSPADVQAKRWRQQPQTTDEHALSATWQVGRTMRAWPNRWGRRRGAGRERDRTAGPIWPGRSDSSQKALSKPDAAHGPALAVAKVRAERVVRRHRGAVACACSTP
jgi:hypothetical protein